MKTSKLVSSFGMLCFVGFAVSCNVTQGERESKEQFFGLNFAGVPKKQISVQGRIANVYYKKKVNGNRPMLLFLHGFGNEPEQLARLFDMPYNFERENFVLLIPRGILGAVKDSNEKKLYWNATDDCCGLEKPNDDAYLVELVRRTISDPDLAIDSKEVYIFGYSNGAFMGYTLACNHADLFSGLIAYAGSSHADANQCKPSQGVHILHVHGTNDRIIRFDSPTQKPPLSDTPWFPPPADIVARWANHNRCFSGKTSEKVSLMSLNLQPDPSFDTSEPPLIRRPGLFNNDRETEVETYQNCEKGKVEFWKISGGTHFNFFNRGTFHRAWKFIQNP